ncbi:MAG: methyltransferase, TIGR04325 family [Terracidiphilus sp.]
MLAPSQSKPLLDKTSLQQLLSSLRGRVKRLPVLRHYLDRKALNFTGRGLYPTFAAALAHIPKNRAISYNTEAAAKMLRTWPIYQFKPSDYCLFFHLRPLLLPGMKLADLGGSVGISYYVLQQHQRLPSGFKWLVCDLPAVIDVGKQIAASQNAAALNFTDAFSDADGCDILISAGTLQYMEESLADRLLSLRKLPSFLLINRTPVWDRDTYYTLQRITDFTCVYRVLNRQQFVDELAALGYRLVADWPCIESTFSVLFHPSTWLNAYRGFYFERVTETNSAVS